MSNADLVRFEVCRPSELSPGDVAHWNTLRQAMPGLTSGFFVYEFALAAERAGYDALISVARGPDGTPVGFLPLQKYPGPGQILGLGQRLAGAMTDYFGLIGDNERIGYDGFFRAAGIGSFQINHMKPRDAGPHETLLPDEGSPITLMPNGFDEWWEAFQLEYKSRAQDLQRRHRKMERDFGPTRFEFEVNSVHNRLDAVISAKSEQYRFKDTVDIFEVDRNRRLLHELADIESDTVKLVVSDFHAADTWAASHIGLRCEHVLHYWFPVYNEELKRTSPGRLLILELLKAASDAEISVIDYGMGESRTKMEFANSVQPLVKGQWVAPGWRGFVARGYQRYLRRQVRKRRGDFLKVTS